MTCCLCMWVIKMADFLEKSMKMYPAWMCIAAVVLLIMHFVMPYHPRERYPRDDPPQRFFASFSLGELIQYVIQVLTFPLILFSSAFIDLRFGLPSEVGAVILFVLAVLWWFLPRNLARRIDGW